jgi:hypothetical protein
MPTDCISYKDSDIFSLMNDYLDEKSNLILYNRFPTLENFLKDKSLKSKPIIIQIELR